MSIDIIRYFEIIFGICGNKCGTEIEKNLEHVKQGVDILCLMCYDVYKQGGDIMTGCKIKRLRLSKGHTQRALADAVGVSMRTIISWEQDERVPRGDKIARLAKALGVSADELLKEEGV